jgi:hypothetical protein
MLRRQHPGEFHAYPDHHHGLGGVVRRALWRLGFDPLTVYERLTQVTRERDYWKGLALADEHDARVEVTDRA